MTAAELEQAYSRACADQAAAIAESHRTYEAYQSARAACLTAEQRVRDAGAALLDRLAEQPA